MIYIKHRVNTLKELEQLPNEWGAEIDIRSDVNLVHLLHLSHDPWKKGQEFKIWLKKYLTKSSQTIIVNTKENGLEEEIIKIFQELTFENYFFLDTSMPILVKYHQAMMGKYFSIRVSSYESADLALEFKNSIQWVWVDCFNGVPLDEDVVKKLAVHFNICLVSPELQISNGLDNIKNFLHLKKYAQAICTKEPSAWK